MTGQAFGLLQVRLVDFNPIGGTTSPLLFLWEELPFSKPQFHATMTQVAVQALCSSETANRCMLRQAIRRLQSTAHNRRIQSGPLPKCIMN